MAKAPQHADLSLNFEDLTYASGASEVDLDSVDDIILSICKGTYFTTPDLVIKYSEDESKFTLDNDAKSVQVKVLSSEIGTRVGKYYVNLYIINSNGRVTHLKKHFDLETAVKYS